MDPFPSQQQLIDHMSNQGNSTSSKEIHMMSSNTINLQTRIQNYDKPIEKKGDHSSSGKAPSTSSPESLSTVPLSIKKPTLDMILHPPKSTLQKEVFNPNTRATQFYNVVEDLASGTLCHVYLRSTPKFPYTAQKLVNNIRSFRPG